MPACAGTTQRPSVSDPSSAFRFIGSRIDRSLCTLVRYIVLLYFSCIRLLQYFQCPILLDARPRGLRRKTLQSYGLFSIPPNFQATFFFKASRPVKAGALPARHPKQEPQLRNLRPRKRVQNYTFPRQPPNFPAKIFRKTMPYDSFLTSIH